MSFAGHVLCQRMLIGPWALTIDGVASAAAPAVAATAPRRNLRRDAGLPAAALGADFLTMGLLRRGLIL